jgi:DNA-binding CsgD family transcriptional regulator
VALMDPELLSVLIGDIYQAAYDQTLVPLVVESLRQTFHGSKACLVRVGPDLQPSDAVASNTDPAFQIRYIEDFAHGSNVLQDAVATAPIGLVYHDHALVGPQKLRASRLWNDWMAPQDMYGGLACKLLTSGPSDWFLDIQRGRHQDAFARSEYELFEFIAPHIRRSVEIRRQFGAAQGLSSVSTSRLPFGTILVDGYQRILTMNEAAENMLARPGAALRSKSGQLVGNDAGSAAALARLITEACSAPDGDDPGLGGDFLITTSRREGASSIFAVSVGPFVRSSVYAIPFEPCAVVAIHELTFDLPAGFTDHIRGLFDLTAKEAAVAVALVSGHSLKQAAKAANVQYSTTRTHLESIFRKTGAKQQSQLVALLKSTRPMFRQP